MKDKNQSYPLAFWCHRSPSVSQLLLEIGTAQLTVSGVWPESCVPLLTHLGGRFSSKQQKEALIQLLII